MVSGAIGAYGDVKAADATANADKANAATFEADAAFANAEKPLVSENARIARRRLAEQYSAALGSFVAQTAAGGLDPNFGSAAAVQSDAKRSYMIDRSILARNEVAALTDKDREAYNYSRQGFVLRMEAKAARKAGYLKAATTLLQAATTASDQLPT